MKFLALLSFSLAAFGMAFAPKSVTTRRSVALDAVSRRDAILGIAGAVTFLGVDKAAAAYKEQAGIGSDRDFANDREIIAAQQPTGDRLDLNAAFVVGSHPDV